MKRILLVCLVMLSLVAFAAGASGEAVFAFEKASYSVDIQKTLTLTPILQGAEKPQNATYVWESADPSIAKVSSGKVTGVKGGTTTIMCALTVEGEMLYETSCILEVPQLITSIKPQEEVVIIREGKSVQLTPTVMPENATNTKLLYSSNDDCISVHPTGRVIGERCGKATVTIEAADGSGKKAKQVIHVVPFVIDTKEIVLTERKMYKLEMDLTGMSIYYMPYVKLEKEYLQPDESLKKEGNAYRWSGDFSQKWFGVYPLKAGTTTITLYSMPGFWNPSAKYTVKVIVEESACFNKKNYPPVDYDAFTTDPNQWTGKVGSVKGKVVRSFRDEFGLYYEIATKENGEGIVMAALLSSPESAPALTSGMSVEIYGKYLQPYTTTTETGLKLNRPFIEIERIGDEFIKYETIKIKL